MSSSAGSDGDFLTLCLQSRRGRKVISMKAASCTQNLYERASMEFGGASIQTLKGGFPPKAIEKNDVAVISSLLSNQERLQVEFGEDDTTQSATKGKGNKKSGAAAAKKNGSSTVAAAAEGSTSSPLNQRKSKRAASKAATESMPELIKAQDELMQQQSGGGRKRSKPSGGGKSIISSPRKQTKPKAAKLSAGAGRRLADGAVVAGVGRKGAARKRGNSNSNSNNPATSSTDLSEALLNSLNDKSQMGIILRKGMKNAVQASYETSKAFSRLAAIQAKNYEMTNTETIACASPQADDPNDTVSSSLQIKFQGSVDRQKVEETVDCIPHDVLTSVVEGIYSSDKEALRPENLARLSPRVLWSCVYYFPTETSMDSIYPLLLPNLDWSFLRRRAQQLSEKARENQRQAAEDQNETMDMEQASNAVQAVEHAMEHLHDYETEQQRARSAQAALARLQQQQEQKSGTASTAWRLITPSEPDKDELRECIESPLTTEEKFNDAAMIEAFVSRLMQECNLHNWRELASVTDIAEISFKLGVSEDEVKAWIEYAQKESVEEIIVEICDNKVEAVELLGEKARSGTPKDLAAWRSIPDVLLEQLRSPDGESDANTSGNHEWVDIVTLKKWCDRAHQLLGEVEWLNWYATPVEYDHSLLNC